MKKPVLFILLVFLSSRLAFTESQLLSTDYNASDICTTQACHDAASRIISMGNPSVEPCDDFYEFACGGFLNSTNSIQEDKFMRLRVEFNKKLQNILEKNITSDDFKYMKLAKTLYRICTKKNYGVYENSMELSGGWPVLEGSQWNESAFNFNKTIFKVGNTTQWKNYFFQFSALSKIIK